MNSNDGEDVNDSKKRSVSNVRFNLNDDQGKIFSTSKTKNLEAINPADYSCHHLVLVSQQ